MVSQPPLCPLIVQGMLGVQENWRFCDPIPSDNIMRFAEEGTMPQVRFRLKGGLHFSPRGTTLKPYVVAGKADLRLAQESVCNTSHAFTQMSYDDVGLSISHAFGAK